jgi:acyl-CoA hydrolase
VYVGSRLVLHAEVAWTGRTSIETEVRIDAEDVLSGEVRHISTAHLVYVAIDDEGRPTRVRPFEPTTPEQRARWTAAEERRARRLEPRLDGVARA